MTTAPPPSWVVEVPQLRPAEHRYIVEVLMQEFLGCPVDIRPTDRNNILVHRNDGPELTMPDLLLGCPASHWLTRESLPASPLPSCSPGARGLAIPLCTPELPVLYGQPLANGEWISTAAPDESIQRIELGLDLFGSCFFFLTRYEEMVVTKRDQYGRFLAVHSMAHAAGLLDRPLVNEYTELLWACLKMLWPDAERKPRSFQVRPSHDVDFPFCYSPAWRGLKRAAGDLVLRRSPVKALQTMSQFARVRLTGARDPYDTYDWLMDQAEANQTTSAFYFKAGGQGAQDHPYPLNNPRLIQRIEHILARGHEIGFHPSQSAFQDPAAWKQEHDKLQSTAQVPLPGGRQHYLLFDVPRTWRRWEENGYQYDATLGYPDRPGFRCGVCYEYPVFDIQEGRTLSLRERPLILMENTLFAEAYLGLKDPDEAMAAVERLKKTCSLFNGDFTVLWHNNALEDSDQRAIYQAVLSK